MTEHKDLKQLVEELQEAKRNTLTCLNDSCVLVDFHGVEYWAARVAALREEIKKLLQEG